MTPGFQQYESTGVSPSLWPNSGRQKGIPKTQTLPRKRSAAENVWAVCVILF